MRRCFAQRVRGIIATIPRRTFHENRPCVICVIGEIGRAGVAIGLPSEPPVPLNRDVIPTGFARGMLNEALNGGEDGEPTVCTGDCGGTNATGDVYE